MEPRLMRPSPRGWPQTVRQIPGGPGQFVQTAPVQASSLRPLPASGYRTPPPASAVPGSVPVYPIFTPQRPPSIPSRTSSKQSAVAAPVAAPLFHEEPRRDPPMPAVPAPASAREKADMSEPLLVERSEVPKISQITVDLERQAEPPPEWRGWSWLRSLLLLVAGVILWIYPERWASVFLLLLALLCSPFLGTALRGGLALPHVGMRRVIASWLLDFGFGIGSAIQEQEKTWKPKLDKALAHDSDFTQGVNKYALQIAGNLGQAVLQEKSQWMPTMVDAVGDIVPPALSRVMEKKEEWTPALTALVADIVPSVMRGVLSHHQGWSPALMQLVGDVVPPVLSSVLKNREWTPALLEFVGEVVPVIIALVLRRPELPPAIAGFIDSAGPSLAPAVVRLIDYIIMDPKLMQTIRKMTDDSMRDEALVRNIKTVIESSLKEGTMYRAVGHGIVAAAEQSLEHMQQRTREKLSSHHI